MHGRAAVDLGSVFHDVSPFDRQQEATSQNQYQNQLNVAAFKEDR